MVKLPEQFQASKRISANASSTIHRNKPFPSYANLNRPPRGGRGLFRRNDPRRAGSGLRFCRRYFSFINVAECFLGERRGTRSDVIGVIVDHIIERDVFVGR